MPETLHSKEFVLDARKLKLPSGVDLTGFLNISLSLSKLSLLGNPSYIVKIKPRYGSLNIAESTFYHGGNSDKARGIYEEISKELEQEDYDVRVKVFPSSFSEIRLPTL